MISYRTRTYALTILLALPPVVLVGVLFNTFAPQPEKVPAVVVANDPEVNLLRGPEMAAKPSPVQVAGSLR